MTNQWKFDEIELKKDFKNASSKDISTDKHDTTFFILFKEWCLITLVSCPPQSVTVVSTFSYLCQYLPCLKYLTMNYTIKIYSYKRWNCGSCVFWKNWMLTKKFIKMLKILIVNMVEWLEFKIWTTFYITKNEDSSW